MNSCFQDFQEFRCINLHEPFMIFLINFEAFVVTSDQNWWMKILKIHLQSQSVDEKKKGNSNPCCKASKMTALKKPQQHS